VRARGNARLVSHIVSMYVWTYARDTYKALLLFAALNTLLPSHRRERSSVVE
jgi:hypothetical protein